MPIDLAQIAAKYNTDKAAHLTYLANYEQIFGPLRDQEVRLLELGVRTGGSLYLWRDYFPRGLIVGLDLAEVTLDDPSGRIRTYAGAQQHTEVLDRIGRENAPEGFDIIIDDCAHIGLLARASFWHLLDHHLKSGGIYVIEDWGTGYWNDWIDGYRYTPGARDYNRRQFALTRLAANLQRSALGRMPLIGTLVSQFKKAVLRSQYHGHEFGMVGFVKELVDEVGMLDITHPQAAAGAAVASKFREIRIFHSHVFIIKQ